MSLAAVTIWIPTTIPPAKYRGNSSSCTCRTSHVSAPRLGGSGGAGYVRARSGGHAHRRRGRREENSLCIPLDHSGSNRRNLHQRDAKEPTADVDMRLQSILLSRWKASTEVLPQTHSLFSRSFTILHDLPN
jgi:hypothetical protein